MTRRSAAAFIATLVFAYAVTAFIQWSADPGDWTPFARSCAGIFGPILGAIIVSLVSGRSHGGRF